MTPKNNCYSCQYLECVFSDDNDYEGYICTKHGYEGDRKEENSMIDRMKRAKYRDMIKRCYTEPHGKE